MMTSMDLMLPDHPPICAVQISASITDSSRCFLADTSRCLLICIIMKDAISAYACMQAAQELFKRSNLNRCVTERQVRQAVPALSTCSTDSRQDYGSTDSRGTRARLPRRAAAAAALEQSYFRFGSTSPDGITDASPSPLVSLSAQNIWHNSSGLAPAHMPACLATFLLWHLRVSL